MITPYIVKVPYFYGIKYIQNATLTLNLKYLTDIIHSKNNLDYYKNNWAAYMIEESYFNEKIILINEIFFTLIELNYFTMELKFKQGLRSYGPLDRQGYREERVTLLAVPQEW